MPLLSKVKLEEAQGKTWRNTKGKVLDKVPSERVNMFTSLCAFSKGNSFTVLREFKVNDMFGSPLQNVLRNGWHPVPYAFPGVICEWKPEKGEDDILDDILHSELKKTENI